MKKLHLICNSHIDPVWQWDWNEGLGAAISTFWQAAKFHEEFDYIFCHGESILYEYIEKHDAPLFEEIKRLVKMGKWHIMGGWYIQPDCNAPSGEAFVRQILLGREYFLSRFGIVPKIALNFDSFGHSLGLPQILAKTEHEGYLFCRPQTHEDSTDYREFWWISPDGSKIKAARADDETVYCSMFGQAAEDIKRKGSHYKDLETGIALWGVGNHGGVNSRKDLEDIEKMIKESADVQIVHSTPESYFAEINPTLEHRKTIQPLIIGSYSSMNLVKKLNAELEAKLFATEKLCCIAELATGCKVDNSKLREVQKILCNIQFHDSLAGTIRLDGEKTTLAMGQGALYTLEEMSQTAYLSLALKDKSAIPGQFPVFMFNYQPYKRTEICEVEFSAEKGYIPEDDEYYFTATQNGKEIKVQVIKELSNQNWEWRKRVAFECELEPLNVSRIDFVIHKRPIFKKPILTDHFVYSDERKRVRINYKTGLLDSYIVNGKEMLSGGAFQPIMYDSTENPWGHLETHIGTNPVPFKLSDCASGITRGFKKVQITEDGPLFTQVESVFELSSSVVILAYRVYKTKDYIDVFSTVFWNEKAKALKFKVPAKFDGKYIGQVAFAKDEHEKDNRDKPTHRFVGFERGKNALVVYNDCIYDTSADGNDLYLLALNGAIYCGHIAGQNPIVKEPERFVPYIEQGKRTFEFRLAYDDVTLLENGADEFTVKPYGYNVFPHGKGDVAPNLVTIDNRAVALKAMFKEGKNYILHIINNNDKATIATVTVGNGQKRVRFNKFEVKTFVYNGKLLRERKELIKVQANNVIK